MNHFHLSFSLSLKSFINHRNWSYCLLSLNFYGCDFFNLLAVCLLRGQIFNFILRYLHFVKKTVLQFINFTTPHFQIHSPNLGAFTFYLMRFIYYLSFERFMYQSLLCHLYFAFYFIPPKFLLNWFDFNLFHQLLTVNFNPLPHCDLVNQ